MSGEYWDGWFDHWGSPHQTTDAVQQARELDWILSQGASINLYMVHGGTSFGFMNGANWDHDQYEPDVTSYDYDAPISESGALTKRYFAFREVIAKHRPGVSIPDPPAALPVIEIPEFELNERASLWSNLPQPIANEHPKSMEAFGQSYGYILYRTKIDNAADGDLFIHELRSYARIFVNEAPVGVLDRRKNQDHLHITAKPNATLDILVEGTGRINFSIKLRGERQGINGPVTLAGKDLKGWQVFPLPMDDMAKLRFSDAKAAAGGPVFYRGQFEVQTLGDTFLDLRGWGKGAVWINGHAVGRFWNAGPQQTLYLPSPWLKRGSNEIVVFTQIQPKGARIHSVRAPIVDQLETE